MKGAVWIIVVFLVAVAVWSVLFTVHETQHAVVTRFGDPRRVLAAPGLYAKWPWPIDGVVNFDKRLMITDLPREDEPPKELLTRDKKNIEVTSYVGWRIADPKKYLERIGTRREDAEARLRDIVYSELGKVLSGHDLDALLSTEPGKMRLPEIMSDLRSACAALVAAGDAAPNVVNSDLGIEIVDFRIRRINFPPQNRASVFDRMRAERKRIATQYRSEGEKQAAVIRATADQQSTEILADAYRQAQEIEGRADAEATRIYAAAFSRDPEFYDFWRSLQSYETAFGEGTTLFLPADTPYLKWLRPDQANALMFPGSAGAPGAVTTKPDGSDEEAARREGPNESAP